MADEPLADERGIAEVVGIDTDRLGTRTSIRASFVGADARAPTRRQHRRRPATARGMLLRRWIPAGRRLIQQRLRRRGVPEAAGVERLGDPAGRLILMRSAALRPSTATLFTGALSSLLSG